MEKVRSMALGFKGRGWCKQLYQWVVKTLRSTGGIEATMDDALDMHHVAFISLQAI